MNKTSSKKIVSTTTVAAIIVLFAFAATCTPVSAATEEEISEAIASGMACLAELQNADGSWGSSDRVARTGFAVLKFETHAIDHDQDPFDPLYEYSDEVITGLDYIFANAKIIDINMEHVVDNPDTNGNGKGVYFTDDGHETYHTSIAMMAIAASEAPTREVDVSDSPVDDWTYEDVVQDAVDYMAWGQTDTGTGRGGWNYIHHDDSGPRSDNSNTGYAVLGLGYAQSDMGCTVPDFVGSELNIWIDYIQNDANGGSGYESPDSWVNILKTGNLLYEMRFCGDDENTVRAQDAIDYICSHWDDANQDPGWKGPPPHYQAMYTTMKGLAAIYDMECDLFKICEPPIEWFDEMTTAIVDTQGDDGCWAGDPYGGTILATEWALLTLHITIEGVTDPDGDEVTITITEITSDEPTATIEGAGGAKPAKQTKEAKPAIHAPDAEGVGTDTASVRAERSGTGNGRVYEISFVASDGIAETEGSVFVKVPHDQSDDCESIDDGQIYDAEY
jgi:hypothetical protein